ncbi:hypothetical protein XENTR_v10018337 [Xenopus tropicalis]|nr:hypothetical protein XENTR_v10018337 [Xenopus tropicalis]
MVPNIHYGVGMYLYAGIQSLSCFYDDTMVLVDIPFSCFILQFMLFWDCLLFITHFCHSHLLLDSFGLFLIIYITKLKYTIADLNVVSVGLQNVARHTFSPAYSKQTQNLGI